MSIKFFFRVDFGKNIGNGHYSRCLNIARELSRNNCKSYFISTQKIQHSDEFECFIIDSQDDINQVIDILGNFQKNEINLIIDHYYIANHLEYEKKLSNSANKLIVIDDLPNREHYCDIFINANIYAKKEDYSKLMLKDNTRMLLGIEYLVLNQDFEKFKNIPKAITLKKRFFIYITSGQDYNLTLLSLKALENFDYDIECVIGISNPNKNEIAEYCKNKNNINLHVQINNIAEIMSKCNFSIGSFGQNTYERLFLNLPTIGMEVADNQRLIGEYCKKNNLAINLGWWQNIKIDDLKNAISEIGDINLNLIDIRQQNKLVNMMILFAHPFKIRQITIDDSSKMLSWRNQDYIRENMITSHIISQEEHDKWFAKIIKSKEDEYFIFEYNNNLIGLIYFNNINHEEKKADWGFYIGESDYLNSGLGFAMEIYAILHAFNDLELDQLNCCVLHNNKAAYNLYIKFGFEEYKRDERFIYLTFNKSKMNDIYIYIQKFLNVWNRKQSRS